MSNPDANESLVPAVGYLRKSTRGERKGGNGERRQKQEKSIPQQREEITKLARGRFAVVKWFEDEGVSGWKRGAKRPDFQQMMSEVSSLGAQAVLCDNIDRFTRATYDDVMEDVRALRKAGVRWVVTASHGEYDLDAGRRNDIAGIITFATAVWMAHEYSRNLGRRIARARRDAAEDGKRTGGPVPYGLADDGKGGLQPGDPAKAGVVVWMFEQFVNHLRSLHWLAGDLNSRKIRGPIGGPWYAKTIGNLLRQRAYRGDFLFNRYRRGQFFGIDADGEITDAAELDGPGKLYLTERAYERPLVDPELFDKAQIRLDTLANNPSRRKRAGYPLTGVLFCAHCGSPLHGVQVRRRSGRRSPTVYRCSGNSLHGQGTCRQHQIREDRILPFILRALGEEVADLTTLYGKPPDELCAQDKQRAERRAQLQAERDKLASVIGRAEENMLFSDDPRTRKSLDARITALRDELERLDAKLAEPTDEGASMREKATALAAWWDQFTAQAVCVPTRYWMENPDNPDEHLNLAVTADPRKVNEALLDIGCEVKLKWKAETFTSMQYKDMEGTLRGGNPKKRYVVTGGRFRLGQQKGTLHKGQFLGRTDCRRASPPCASRPGARRSRPPARG